MIEILLPWPDMSLMPNRKNGRHWGGTQAAKVRARQDGYLSAREALGTRRIDKGVRLPMRITFVSPDKRSRDIDNLLACVKPHLDGIAQSLGVDDKHFRPITLDGLASDGTGGYLIVEIG